MKPIKNILIGAALTASILISVMASSPANKAMAEVSNFHALSAKEIGKSLIHIPAPILNGEKTYKLSHFKGIGLAVNMDIEVDLHGQHALRVEGDQDAINDLIVEVSGSNLIIRPRISWKIWNANHGHKKLKAYLSASELNAIAMSGSGTIKINETLSTNTLAVNISGSGNVIGQANINLLNCNISGSGNVNLHGSTQKASVIISGSGKLANGLEIEDLAAVISGSGSISAKVDRNLNAIISGSGKVSYSGNPSITRKISGSGRIVKI